MLLVKHNVLEACKRTSTRLSRAADRRSDSLQSQLLRTSVLLDLHRVTLQRAVRPTKIKPTKIKPTKVVRPKPEMTPNAKPKTRLEPSLKRTLTVKREISKYVRVSKEKAVETTQHREMEKVPKTKSNESDSVLKMLQHEHSMRKFNAVELDKEDRFISRMHVDLSRQCVQFGALRSLYNLDETVSIFRQPQVLFDLYLQHAYVQGYHYDCLTALKFLHRNQIIPLPSSFAYTLLAISIANKRKLSEKKLWAFIEEVVSLAHRNQINLSHICNGSFFSSRHQDIIESMVRLVDPKFCLLPDPVKAPHPQTTVAKLCSGLRDKLPKTDYLESPYFGCLPKGAKKREALVDEQLANESLCFIDVPSAAAIPNLKGTDLREWKHLQKYLRVWSDKFTTAINKLKSENAKKLVSIIETTVPQASTFMMYLNCLPTEDIVGILDRTVLSLISDTTRTHGLPSPWVEKRIGTEMMQLFHAKIKTEKGLDKALKDVYKIYMDLYLDEDKPRLYNHREWFNQCLAKENNSFSLHYQFSPWSYVDYMHVGRVLLQLIIDQCTTDKKYGFAFTRKISISRNTPRSDVCLSSNFAPFVGRTEPNPQLSFPVHALPMVCPPKPWLDPFQGGLLMTSSEFIRLIPLSKVYMAKILSEEPIETLYSVLDSLNILGSVGWMVNEPILGIMLQLFKNPTSELAEKYSDKLEIARPVSALSPIDEVLHSMPELSDNPLKLRRTRFDLRQERAEKHSLYCTALYRYSIASMYSGRVVFFPHNMDFRGRVYPIAPYFNHMGDDVSRGMLKFAQGRPLGEKGFDWLKLHCINLTGKMKKESISSRLDYADKILLDKIVDSALNPLGGSMWWMDSDAPWQTLACCIEINNALQCNIPSQFVSHLPIHQDGSCNGLQHYAALGRDEFGAKEVNVSPSPVPQDVYEAVAKKVEDTRRKDALGGPNALVAQICENAIQRKVVKQTVMTTVYGVTSFGARLQVEKQLEDLELVPPEHLFISSMYISKLIFHAIGDMFASSRSLQIWLTQLAHRIAATCKQTVEWSTPLGLPVAQPYLKTHHKLKIDLPQLMKQKNSFPPNYIHSLDGTHMMLTSLYCYKEGINFASVHDCFWTHACTVDQMNKICREQFVAMYKQPILENLCQSLVKRYLTQEFKESVSPASYETLRRAMTSIPKRGKLDISSVLDSVYFFS